MIVIETDRLILRHFRVSDAPALEAVFGDAEVMRYGDGVQTRGWIETWLQARLDADRHRPRQGVWAVDTKEGTRTIGYCGLFDFPDINGRPEVEVGYRLARAFWGQGFATEAARAVRDHAFRTLGLARLIALIEPDNSRSIRVAVKLGMTYVADVMLDGYTHPDHVYCVENSEVQADLPVLREETP